MLIEYNIDPEENSGYWYASDKTKGINISISFDRAKEDGNAKVCRDYYVERLKKSSSYRMSDESYSETDDSKAIYEYTLKEVNGREINQKYIYIYGT